jgi:hypothetical protein
LVPTGVASGREWSGVIVYTGVGDSTTLPVSTGEGDRETCAFVVDSGVFVSTTCAFPKGDDSPQARARTTNNISAGIVRLLFLNISPIPSYFVDIDSPEFAVERARFATEI